MGAVFTYAELAREFGRSVDSVKRDMRAWEAQGFPAPLPWSLRQKRWDPDAVRRWKARQELRAGALGAPELRIAGSR